MRAFLVRVGVDQAYGKWNAPVELSSRRFVFVPIPDGHSKRYTPENARSYKEVQGPLASFGRAFGAPGLHCPATLLERTMHLDPDFATLTYGDNGARRGKGISTLISNDLLAFYAGLRSISSPRKLHYALIGIFVVEEVIRALDVPPKRRHENAHTRWTEISESDIIVRGKPGVSGRFDRCIMIGSWREGAYRVDPNIEKAWGGLSVKNGFIQRSVVPPEFSQPARFRSWLRKQKVTLLKENF